MRAKSPSQPLWAIAKSRAMRRFYNLVIQEKRDIYGVMGEIGLRLGVVWSGRIWV